MPENVIFGWPRWTPSVTWSGGSWDADWPVSNVGDLPLARVARSADLLAASTQIIGTLPRDRACRLFALVRHNLTVAAQFRLRLYADAARTTEVYDSAFSDVWPEMFPFDTLEWEDDNYWTGTYSTEDLEGSTWTRPIWLETPVTARAFLLEITDPTNPAGYVEVGLMDVAQGWQPALNVSYGYQTGFRSRTVMVEALAGSKYFDRRPKPRMVKGEIKYLLRDEAMTKAFEMLRQQDLDVPMLWFPFADRPTDWVRDCMLARLVDPGLLTIPHHNRMNFPFALEEVQ